MHPARSLASNTHLLRTLVGQGARTMSSSSAPASSLVDSKYSVEENVDRSRFEMLVDAQADGEDGVAFVEYVKQGNTYDLVESLVPEKYAGRGLGKILARLTFEEIIRQNGQLKLTCDFLKHFYKQNEAEFREHIAK